MPVHDTYLSNELEDAKDGREDDVPWREIRALFIEFSTCGGRPGRIRRDMLIPYDKKLGWLAAPRGPATRTQQMAAKENLSLL